MKEMIFSGFRVDPDLSLSDFLPIIFLVFFELNSGKQINFDSL
jgi:hypothetical protein